MKREMSWVKFALIVLLLSVLCAPLLGLLIKGLMAAIPVWTSGGSISFREAVRWGYLLQKETYTLGISVYLIIVALILYYKPYGLGKNVLKREVEQVESSMENASFMTDKERDYNFPPTTFSQLPKLKKDGLPAYAVYNKARNTLNINIVPPMHALIIGSTGSGKTTTFINPTIQILGSSAAGSSMICTDPKGELFQMHSKMLQERGYKVMVLDLRETYSSFRWNPLATIYRNYQEYIACGDGIYLRSDNAEESELELVNDPSDYGEEWFEYRGKAYADRRELLDIITVAKQKIYDEVYEDLNDIISVLCPIESEKDPIWDRGARSIVFAIALAMLEDVENPELQMTEERFSFYNLNKIVGTTDNNYAELRNYFAGRSILAKSVGQSKQVLSAAPETLASYMTNAFDKLGMFNDEGLCALTSAMDIDPSQFANEPTALFLKIPDEKDTRHKLAAIFILSIYKALIKVASAREDLSLPRNVYFLLDEFGNMPKINKFENMITVGRSRKIWFTLVLQSYAQLDAVYGDKVSQILKSNCGFKMFIGSNDIATCEEFSKLCGNMSVITTSASRQVGGVGNSNSGVNVSNQLQTRPLIYPSELQKMNNKRSTGNAIIVTFGNNPLKTLYTPSYRCPLYKMGTMTLDGIKDRAFYGNEVFYNIALRNQIVMAQMEQESKAAEQEQGAEQTDTEPAGMGVDGIPNMESGSELGMEPNVDMDMNLGIGQDIDESMLPNIDWDSSSEMPSDMDLGIGQDVDLDAGSAIDQDVGLDTGSDMESALEDADLEEEPVGAGND